MDREQMRQLAFGNAQVKLDLEAILHPLIGEQTWVQAAGATPGQAIVFDVPLLTESAHWRALVDRVLLVDCEESTQVQRVMQRSGWSAEQVLKVIQAQASRPQRRAIADAIIHNDQVSLAELNSGLRRLWQDGFMTGITGSDTVKQSGTP
jgi:dephospho-CoA kinase